VLVQLTLEIVQLYEVLVSPSHKLFPFTSNLLSPILSHFGRKLNALPA
jgi:hypothetical protein